MKLSIIIATFNARDNIRNVLKCITNQSYQDWECIIVDGASRDDTICIVEEFEKNDSRIKHISEPDNGIYDAFNKGWRLARGEWIYYLGADDELLPTSMERIMQINGIERYDIVYGNIIEKFSDGKCRYPKSKSYHMIRYRMFAGHQAMLVKRSIIENLGGFDLQYKIKADFELIQRAYISGAKFYKADVIIAIFSQGGVSTTDIPWFDKERYLMLKNNNTMRYPAIVVLGLGVYLHLKRLLLKIKNY